MQLQKLGHEIFYIFPQVSVPYTTVGSALWAGNHGWLLVVLWNLQYRGPFALTSLSYFYGTLVAVSYGLLLCFEVNLSGSAL